MSDDVPDDFGVTPTTNDPNTNVLWERHGKTVRVGLVAASGWRIDPETFGIIARPRLLCAGCDMELIERTTDARPPEPLDGAFVRDRASGEMLRYHHGEWTAVPPDQSDAS